MRNTIAHNRRHFYKISLVLKGEGILSFADKSYHIKDKVIAFFNPMISYSWEPLSTKNKGYSCLFTDEFINQQLKAESLSKAPLFAVSGDHVLAVNDKSIRFMTSVFEQMIVEMQSGYAHKHELLRNYVQIIIHEALKIAPPETSTHAGSAARITASFIHLLEKQFPVVSLQYSLPFKNANEFAGQLAIQPTILTGP